MYKGALSLGSNIHAAILEFDRFKIKEFKLPSDKMVKVVNILVNIELTDENIVNAFNEVGYHVRLKDENKIKRFYEEGLEYYNILKEKKENEIYMSEEAYTKMVKCKESVLNKFNGTLYPEDHEIYTEFEIYFPIKIDGTVLDCKAKIDRWTYDPIKKHVTLIDLKTTSKPISKFFGTKLMGDKSYYFKPGSFQEHAYYRQLAFYLHALKWYLKEKNIEVKTISAAMLVVETANHYESALFYIDQEWLDLGKEEFMSALKDIKYRMEIGDWSYQPNIF
jgi:hypothetical protein